MQKARIGLMWKQFFIYLLIIVLTSSFLVFFVSREINKYYINNLKSNLENQALLVERMATDLMIPENAKEIDALAKEMGKKIGTRITIIRKDGLILGDSEKDPTKMENHATRPEVIQALRNEIGSKIRYSTTVKKEMLYVAIPITENGEILGVVRTSSFVPEIQKSLGTINKKIIYIVIILMIIVLLFSILSSRLFTNPIKEIAFAAEKIKNGDFTTRIFIKRKDELGELSDAINEMARELQKLFTNLNLQREELQVILSSMVEGLVVINEEEKIVLSNKNFSTIADTSNETQIQNKRYWEVLQNNDINKLVKSVFRTGKTQTCETQFGEKIYLVNGALTSKTGGRKIIIVLHDITELKRVAKIKADFVTNITHELKTPLTSIKGFVETLKENNNTENQHFLEIIERNTNRLIDIVDDLLLLSNLEDKKQKLKIEKINLRKMADNILRIFEIKFKEKKISFKLDISDNISYINADPFWLEQLFINLIDNAIKYTDKGHVEIKILSQGKDIQIEIQDSGIGIPKKHLSRIFERFYVVDKSRSHKLGGTGLGLSIVKHIVQLHNGKISVESKVGKGSKFIITLPKG
ncbi:MAG: HAMP domain-containing protein [Caldisericaceae bacterium]|nr:HAMP domain-containing protein [Caldisericaceae bacterium]